MHEKCVSIRGVSMRSVRLHKCVHEECESMRSGVYTSVCS